jgi:hypothetical protein
MLLGDEPMFAAGVGADLPVGGEAVCASRVGGSDPVPPADRVTEVASDISATGLEATGAADVAGKLALCAADMPCAITGPAAFSAANAARANVSNAAITKATKRIIISVNLPFELCALLGALLG